MNYGSKSVGEITRVKEYKSEGSVSEEGGRETMKFHKKVSFVGYHPPRVQNMRIQVVNQRGPISNDVVVATASINMMEASFFDDDVTENDHGMGNFFLGFSFSLLKTSSDFHGVNFTIFMPYADIQFSVNFQSRNIGALEWGLKPERKAASSST